MRPAHPLDPGASELKKIPWQRAKSLVSTEAFKAAKGSGRRPCCRVHNTALVLHLVGIGAGSLGRSSTIQLPEEGWFANSCGSGRNLEVCTLTGTGS